MQFKSSGASRGDLNCPESQTRLRKTKNMNTSNNTPTSSASNAHDGQTDADNNKTRIIRTTSELRQFFAERLARPSVKTNWGCRQVPKPPVCAHSRKQALADALEMQVPPEFIKKTNEDWDLIFDAPLFLTKKAFELCESVSGRSLYTEQGPLWEILCVLDHAFDCPILGCGSPMVTRLPIEVKFGTSATAPRVCLNIAWSTLDIDDPQPAFTVMLPEENWN
jgi:hypothetical protein